MTAQLIQLPKFEDERGNLSFFEDNNQIPFKIRRIHWIYDVPGGQDRGGVAYKETEEFVVAMSGSFDVTIDDGSTKTTISLNRSYKGVYIPKGVWRTIDNYSSNSIAVIAASTHYDPTDGIRDYDEFLRYNRIKVKEKIQEPNHDRFLTPKSCSKHNVYDCGIIELDRHHSVNKGNLSVVENCVTVPFDIKRLYYLYDVPGGESRGGHAHRNLYQLIIAASGCFTVTLDDGNVKRAFTLNRPYQALLVKPGIWRTLDDFSSGSSCLVLASDKYDPEDYIRDYEDFLNYRK